MTVNKDRLALGIAALRSGLYTQGQNALKMAGADGMVKHCCLGVLTEVAIDNGCGNVQQAGDVKFEVWIEKNCSCCETGWRIEDSGILSSEAAEWFGLPSNNPRLCHGDGERTEATALNDSGHYDFEYIAGAFEQTFMGDEQQAGS